MIEPSASIVGIVQIDLDVDRDALTLVVALADGSCARTWWPLSEMHRYLSRVTLSNAPRAPGAVLQGPIATPRSPRSPSESTRSHAAPIPTRRPRSPSCFVS